MTIREFEILHARHRKQERLRDLYWARQTFYLAAAVTDPKKRGRLRLDKFRLLKERTGGMSPRAVMDAFKMIAAAQRSK